MGADTLTGGQGRDTLDYSGSDAGVSVNLLAGTASGGHAAGDVLRGFEIVEGSAHGDTLIGGAGADHIDGGGGDDRVEGGAGADTLAGAEGRDTLDYSGSGVGVSVNLATGAASGGDAAGDALSGFENLEGSAHGDTLTGSGSANVIRGAAGADSVDGGGGDDRIEGGVGADTLTGGQGRDILDYSGSNAGVSVDLSTHTASGGHASGDSIGGFEDVVGSTYADTLTASGGTTSRLTGLGGNDRFVFTTAAASHTITDFEDGKDLIEFTDSHGADAYDDINPLALNGGTLLNFEDIGGWIFLEGVAVGDLDASDFLF